MGKIASNLLGEGVKLGVSSRGVGSLNKTNEGYSGRRRFYSCYCC